MIQMLRRNNVTLISWTHFNRNFKLIFRRMCPMKNRNNSNRYNDDFRRMIVELYNSGETVKDLSSEYGIPDATIYSWINKYTPVEFENGSKITPDDYAQLQKQMQKLKEENDILKKAMAKIGKA